MDPPEEGIQIAATTQSIKEEIAEEAGLSSDQIEITDEPPPDLGLGDRIQIESTSLGRVVGRIYYLDEDLLRVLPDGVSNRLYNFPITAEGIDPDLGVTEILTEPTEIPSFVEQNLLRVGVSIDTFTGEGEKRNSYIVDSVNLEADSVILIDSAGEKEEVVFNFTGIPRDLPFEVLRVASTREVATEVVEVSPEISAESPTEGEEEEEILGEIEVPILTEVSDIPISQRFYPETVQKNDLFIDLLTLIDPASQKNPNILRKIRTIVEATNALIHQVTEYAMDGSPIGTRSASFSQIADLLRTATKVPLSRPVLEAVRTLYLDHSIAMLFSRPVLEAVRTLYLDHSTTSDTPMIEPPVTTQDFDINFIGEAVQRAEEAAAAATLSASENPRLYTELSVIIDYLQRPWKAALGGAAETYSARVDKDFFRRSAPQDDVTVPGLNPTGEKDPTIGIHYSPELLDSTIDFSLMRLIAPVYRKIKTGKGDRNTANRYIIAIPGDRAPLVSHLLFPHSTAHILGATRTYVLSRDIGRSSIKPTNMKEILAQIGNVSEVPTASSIVNIGPHGNTFGNIAISDYFSEILKLMPFQQFLGLDDFRILLTDLGLEEYELNLETTEVLQTRVLLSIARLRSIITSLRTTLQEHTETQVISVTPFLDDTSATELEHWLKSDPILSEDIETLKKATPILATIDIVIIAYLLNVHPDLLISYLGRQAQLVEKERLRAKADTYLATVKAALTVRENHKNSGEPPTPNTCEHVKTLVTIRRIRDDSERLALLAKFLSRFQGDRDENYVDCIVCGKHLLCIHEILQIQMVLRPREQEVLQKELFLKMSGGIHSGSYICRNCGQPISELQFDSHIEFTDGGAPLNGQILLVDPDEVEEEQLGLQLGAFIPGTDDLMFDNEAKTLCYTIAQEIFQRVGIYPGLTDYRNVVEAAFLRIQTLDSREEYEKKRKIAVSKGSKGIPDYDTYIKGFTVTSVAALVLIDIQTHIPDYVVRYTIPGCEAGFGGFPLHDTPRTGLIYMSCAVGSITRNDEPWNRTGFLSIRSDETRRNTIAKFMESVLTKILATEPTIQQKIATKLEYLRETFGAEAAEGRPAEKIPFGFLPRQEVVKAEDPTPVVPEAATNQHYIAAAWIRDAHKHALRTAQLVKGNPFAETACCFGPITSPGAYWETHKSIMLSSREPPISSLFRSSLLFSHFTPKPITELPVEVNQELAYRIFLKVCYTGPRMGYAHELGYNGICDNCGLKLSTKYLFPDYSLQTSKKASAPIINTAELISDLQAQGVNVTPEFFQQVLDRSHLNYIVPPPTVKSVTPVTALLSRLGDLQTEPVSEWKSLLSDLIQKLGTVAKDPSDTDIALAYGTISEIASEAEQFVKQRLGSSAQLILEKWINSDTKLLFEIVLIYLITPLQRLITKYDIEQLKTPRIYELGYTHSEDLNKGLAAHVENLRKYMGSLDPEEQSEGHVTLAAAKSLYFLEQIQGLARFAQEIQPSRVPGGVIGTRYLKRILFLGPFAELLNFNRVPPTFQGEVASESLVDKSGTVLVAFIGSCMRNFVGEALSYSPNEIRLRIAKAKEKEKITFIKDQDGLDDDAKKVELVKKRLGIGRWAIGGSKLIFAYDADQYEKERDDRIKNGETDIPLEQGVVPPGNNQVFDMLGAAGGAAAADQFYEAQGGYDVAQETADDL